MTFNKKRKGVFSLKIKPSKNNFLFMIIIVNVVCLSLFFSSSFFLGSNEPVGIPEGFANDSSSNSISPLILPIIKGVVIFVMIISNFIIIRGMTGQFIRLDNEKLFIYKGNKLEQEVLIEEIEFIGYTTHNNVQFESVMYDMYLFKLKNGFKFELSTGLYSSNDMKKLLEYCKKRNYSITDGLN